MKNAAFESTAWPDGVIQLLDDHHLVVLSDSGQHRRKFVNTLKRHLDGIADTEVVLIDGASAVNLNSFCRQIEPQMLHDRTGPIPISREFPHRSAPHAGMQSVIEMLRHAASLPKRRYFLWDEAHIMLENDVELFCRLVNAIFGVAAECEHINLDPLVLQRAVFIGAAKLGAYAEDDNGQFCRWLDDDEDSPFWEVASVIERPPVITYRIDD